MSTAKLYFPLWLRLLFTMLSSSGNNTDGEIFPQTSRSQIKKNEYDAMQGKLVLIIQSMSPTKSGARSRKRSLPRAHRMAPFIRNLW